MKQTLTYADFAPTITHENICENCHRPISNRVDLGPLSVVANPDQAFWHGKRIKRVTATQIRLLRLLMRFRRLEHLALLAVLGEDTTDMTLKTHISHLRNNLKWASEGDVTIQSIHGWGYELVVRDFE